MNYPRRSEITEMWQRGYDRSTIAEAERLRREGQANDVRTLIQDAFSGVKLGSGTGLQEAQALDDYGDASTRGECRAKDEKESWEKISIKTLNACYGSLSFLDAEGMRFHLPVFLIAGLGGTFNGCVESSLTSLDDRSMARFSLLSDDQRAAVRAYLAFKLGEFPHRKKNAALFRALNEYWAEPMPQEAPQ